jgi:hypothetical protein
MIWRMASSRCSSVLALLTEVALGQDDLHRLQEGDLVAHRPGFIERAAEGERPVIARAVSANRFLPSFCPSTWLAAPASRRWPAVRKSL